MNILKDKKIAIVGGGPGGLTLARLLQMNGADVTVYERDKSKDARAQGATLDLHEESGLLALRQAGLMDDFRANYRPGAEQLRITDKHAQILFEDQPKAEEEILRPEIDRGPLQKILLAALLPGTVVWDSHFVALSLENGGWLLEFKNGSVAYADLVIAADGANSKVRPYITPIKPFFSGITVIEGAVYDSAINSPKIHKLLNGGKIFAMGDNKSLVVSSKGDGSLVFYTSFKTGENWIRQSGIDFSYQQQVLDWFKVEYEGWDDIFTELFENASISYFCRPLYCMPVDQTWEPLPNLTMIGDAAHLMPPFAGEGVNMAMLDALELSKCLTGDEFPDLQSAIAAFEKQMCARASATAMETLEATEALHSPNAIAYFSAVIS